MSTTTDTYEAVLHEFHQRLERHEGSSVSPTDWPAMTDYLMELPEADAVRYSEAFAAHWRANHGEYDFNMPSAELVETVEDLLGEPMLGDA
jgi:hypothetical protein